MGLHPCCRCRRDRSPARRRSRSAERARHDDRRDRHRRSPSPDRVRTSRRRDSRSPGHADRGRRRGGSRSPRRSRSPHPRDHRTHREPEQRRYPSPPRGGHPGSYREPDRSAPRAPLVGAPDAAPARHLPPPPASDEPPQLWTLHRGTVHTIRPFGLFVAVPGYRRHVLVHHTQVRRGLCSQRRRARGGIPAATRAANVAWTTAGRRACGGSAVVAQWQHASGIPCICS